MLPGIEKPTAPHCVAVVVVVTGKEGLPGIEKPTAPHCLVIVVVVVVVTVKGGAPRY